MNEPLTVDLLVVGAGPAGLFATFCAGFRGLSVAVMDALPELGGQVGAMYPEKAILDIAGLPAVTGRDLVEGLTAQAMTARPHLLLGHTAQTLAYEDGTPVVTSDQGLTVRAAAVLVTGGIGAFTPRPLPGCTGYEGRGLSYFVTDLDDLTDRDVLVVGGGDSAFDWALAAAGRARSVTLAHRRDTFRAHRATVDKVLASEVQVCTRTQVAALHCGPDGHIESAELNGPDGTRRIKAQRVVAALGFTANLGPLESWGMALDGRHIAVDSHMATSLPRVFAAGDITAYPGKVRLIAVGFGEAATAVNNAATVLDPGSDLFPGHSTDRHGTTTREEGDS
ncbi:NAD(P)/FAD-dependent oxidoreductase [Streptomyces tirandamycinicus]|uniref:Ferredoxin--NADP reductase n=1 Tax=Streptomyces tirandamycinicus TaxID=2174846 RepID=A0A2S1ST23_9ACTN|nr:NAD(P)/FAD-dependent oxidoreductase [Streptomyces tirandamycinicus]AWI29556.1 NAD(P)/FAD-dependent oxidoreductase [Streptomyces tirandamycinicus]MCY0981601.1 NAD(P)/FAD-dependent oxidoreductase [Streptomyces tirandamycinicus]